MQQKILKVIFVIIGALIVLGLVVVLLPLLIIGLLLGLFFGKLKISKLNSLRNRSYGAPGKEDVDISGSSIPNNDSAIDYQDEEIIDIQAVEIKEKE